MFLCINVKAFYASIECVDRGRDPDTTSLIVLDQRDNAVLSVSPMIEKRGFAGRIPKNMGYSSVSPRQERYIEVSRQMFEVYLKYFSEEDIHVRSISEVFINLMPYLLLYNRSPKGIAEMILNDIHKNTGLSAYAGVGTNLYLSKVAADLVAGRQDNTRIGCLNEAMFQAYLWDHTPLTDFWDIKPATTEALSELGAESMYDIAQIPEDILYASLGDEAESLIEHCWGQESATIADLKGCRDLNVIYDYRKTVVNDQNGVYLILKGMIASAVRELQSSFLYAGSVRIIIGYDENLFSGKEVEFDALTCSFKEIENTITKLYWLKVNEFKIITGVGIMLGKLSYEKR